MMNTQPQDETVEAVMETTTETIAETSPPLSMGGMLREARMQQELTIADVAAQIKFAPRQVEALEADDFARLPELAFVRGFIRSYARLLRIDEVALLNALPQTSQQPETKKHADEVLLATPQSARRINVVWLSAALGLAVILAIGVLFFRDGPAHPKPLEAKLALPPVEVYDPTASAVEAASASAVSVVPEVIVASSVAATKVKENIAISVTPLVEKKESIKDDKKVVKNAPIHLVFHAESWVDIRDKTGKTIFKQVNEPGSEQWVEGQPPFSLVIGNASGVRLYYENEQIDLKEYTNIEVARLTLK